MEIRLKAYANCDDVHLVWTVDAAIPRCLGFAIECRRRRGGRMRAKKALSNRVGFAADNPGRGEKRSSRRWPFQRYSWTDHAADLGDEIEYRVVARVGSRSRLVDGPASDWSGLLTLSTDCDGSSAAFNRGFVISQFVARMLAKEKLSLAEFKDRLGAFEDNIRQFLSGELRRLLLSVLAEVGARPGASAFAALYELEDDELEAALIALGEKVEVVLANGSVRTDGEDQNAAARQRLKAAGITVHDRMVSPGALGHNKFVVLCDKVPGGVAPRKVLTGSTNWTRTGLCTQVNNALVIDDAAVAGAYLDHWRRLRDGGSSPPNRLKKDNPSPTGPLPLAAGMRASVWLTPVRRFIDLEALKSLVTAASDGILFVMFNPGSEPLRTILARQKAGLYARGVVNQIGNDEREEIKLIKAAGSERFFLDVIEPQGIASPLAGWAAEVTRQQFKGEVGFAMTHSKCLVIDPFGARPVVVTGSHNFSKSASASNDDNFVVIEGNRRLAEAYAVNCMMTYQHYRWRQYLQDSAARGRDAFEHLSEDSEGWQKRLAAPQNVADRRFWIGQ